MGLAILLLIGLALAIIGQVVYTAWLLTHPPRRAYVWAVSRNLPGNPSELPPPPDGPGPRAFDAITFISRGMTLHAWSIPGDNPDGPTIIWTHGWGESRVQSLLRLPALLPHACRVVLWDLPAHGDSGGHLTMGLREPEDLRALIDAVDADRVVLGGFSLGAGVSIAAGVREGARVVAVIAEAPYRVPQTPARNVLRQIGMPTWPAVPLALGSLGLIRFSAGFGWFNARGPASYDRAGLAASLKVPLLVLTGEADQISPPEDGRAIASRATLARVVAVEGAGHLNMWIDPAFRSAATAAVRDFLMRLNRH
jgi:uncharacterized protein